MKKIFISKNVKEYITLTDTALDNIVLSDIIIDDITNILSEMDNKPLFAILIIHLDEHEKLSAFLRRFNNSDINYKFIIIDPGKKFCQWDQEKLLNIIDLRTSKISGKEFTFLIERTLKQIEDSHDNRIKWEDYQSQLHDTKQDQDDLIKIGKSLSLEKDPGKLLRTILFLSKRITGADAGSIFLVEEIENGKKQLRFKYSHTFSKEIPIEEFVMPYDTNSIAGYVAVTGNILNIPDAYNLSPDAPVSFNKSVDQEHGYHCKSMLVVPMRNHIDEIIGVIQLINSKEVFNKNGGITGNEAFEVVLKTKEDYQNKVVSFDERYEGLMEAIASQAAIAIENNRMIRQIESQFEEFVKASINAIESRDTATSGHSLRVADICKKMAAAINNEKDGKYKDVYFSENQIKELEFASLLHDFGKVYTDVSIFMKGKKLFPKDFDNVMLKFNYLYRLFELHYYLNETEILKSKKDIETLDKEIEELKSQRNRKLKSIEKIIDEIRKLNEPTITELDPNEVIKDIISQLKDINCCDIEGKKIEILTDEQRMNLEIKRGTLNPYERKEIEDHVIHTYNFVSKIPWPPEYKNIPEFALKHHEKMDGSGYPNKLKEDRIPLQARMMAIADFYDALTASDRPYKKAISPEKALSILQSEAENNKVDRDLLDIFIKHKIYQ